MPIQSRNRHYKERILSAPYEICIERARYYTESYRESEGQDPAVRAAKAFAHALRHMSVHILDTELIAGNRSSKIVGAVIPVERGDINSVIDIDLDFLTTRERQPFHITPEDERELRKTILPYWRGKTLRDRKKALWKANGLYVKPALNPLSLYRRSRSLNMNRLREAAAVPRLSLSYLYKGLKELLYNNPALIMNVFDVQGHLILGHKNILREGFAGLKARALDGLRSRK